MALLGNEYNLERRIGQNSSDRFVSTLTGGMFSNTEMSKVLTEIVKMDPKFDKELFIRDCRDDIIPNVLEAISRGDLEILEDWCHEAVSRNYVL